MSASQAASSRARMCFRLLMNEALGRLGEPFQFHNSGFQVFELIALFE
jgi:hypothetical protein